MLRVVMDKDSVIHKILTYGVAFTLIVSTMFLSPGADNLPESCGTWIILFILK